MRNSLFYKILLVAATLLLSINISYAQQRAKETKCSFLSTSEMEKVYDRYDEAMSKPSEEWVISFADTLARIGKEIPIFEYYYYCIKTHHYFDLEVDSMYYPLTDKLLEIARERGYISEYFTEMANKVSYQINREQVLAAQRTARTLIKEGREMNEPSGEYFGYYSLGVVAMGRFEYRYSNEQYQKALDVARRSKYLRPEVEAYLLYLMAYNYYNLRDYETALWYLDLSTNIAVVTDVAVNSLRAVCYFETKQYDKYRTERDEFLIKHNNNSIYNQDERRHMDILQLILEGQYETALALCDKLSETDDVYAYKQKVYKACGDFDNVYKYKDLQYEYIDSVTHTVASEEMNALTAELENLKEIHAKEDEIMKQRVIIICISAGLVIILFIFAGIFIYQRSKRREAVKANETKIQFIQNMSHEIRTPLNAIVGFSQLLGMPDGTNTPSEKEEYNNYIANNTAMLQMILDDIFDLSDLEKGEFKVDLNDVECNTICRYAIGSFEGRVPENVKLYFTTEVDDTYKIRTDSRRVQQVLVNLISNACKCTNNGEIRLHCSTSENFGHTTFSVTDTGIGIPADKVDKVFERFVKLDEFAQGTGLGLSICRNIAEKLNGELILDTSYKDGARFVFVI